MLRKSIAGCLVLCFLFALDLPAQTGDWSSLFAIPSGARVSVIMQRQRHFMTCTLVNVTDDELVCELGSPLFGPRTRVFPRGEVREVRREYGRELKMAAGAAIGAAAGAGIGIAAQNKNAETRRDGAMGGILLGGIVGLIVGRIFSEHHGRVIYQR